MIIDLIFGLYSKRVALIVLGAIYYVYHYFQTGISGQQAKAENISINQSN